MQTQNNGLDLEAVVRKNWEQAESVDDVVDNLRPFLQPIDKSTARWLAVAAAIVTVAKFLSFVFARCGRVIFVLFVTAVVIVLFAVAAISALL